MLNNEDLRPLPYRERLTALMNLLASAQHRFIKYVETAFTTKQKIALWKRLKAGKPRRHRIQTTGCALHAGRPNSGGHN